MASLSGRRQEAEERIKEIGTFAKGDGKHIVKHVHHHPAHHSHEEHAMEDMGLHQHMETTLGRGPNEGEGAESAPARRRKLQSGITRHPPHRPHPPLADPQGCRRIYGSRANLPIR